MHKFSNAKDAETFILAGNATVTISSLVTGVRYTFKIRQCKDNETGKLAHRWFVSLLTGSDNTNDYTYFGLLDTKNGLAGGVHFRPTGKSKLNLNSTPVKAFIYMWEHVYTAGNIPAKLEIRHEGSCGRCGRLLTVPESIDRVSDRNVGRRSAAPRS